MPLPINLNTNEVKDRAGTEVEYLWREDLGRAREWMKSGEQPAYPMRIKIQHREVGKPGSPSLVRQSNLLTTDTVVSQVDTVTPTQIRFSTTAYVPIGHLTDLNAVKDAGAKHISMLASLGASTTILYDNTGTALAALTNGTL